MNRHHSPRTLCRLLEAHHENMGAYLAELHTACERGIPEQGGEDNPELLREMKGRIVDEANKILALLSPG